MVDLADARVRLRSRAQPSNQNLLEELDEVRSLLDQGLSAEAKSRIALADRCGSKTILRFSLSHVVLLSTALEMQGQYRDSLAAVAMYESPESRAKLDQQAIQSLKVQIGLAYNYNGDHPKAISILKGALREFSESGRRTESVQSMRHWRASIAASLNIRLPATTLSAPWSIFAKPANGAVWQKHTSESHWRDMQEGDYEAAWKTLQQALKLIGDHPASYTLGKIYANMAGACWFLKRPQEGIRYLEKAIAYYERTDHKGSAANGYNNLGINLILMGQWGRAQEALQRALSLASEADERAEKVPMILDSLGELLMLRGELDEAKDYLVAGGRPRHRGRQQVVCVSGAQNVGSLLPGDGRSLQGARQRQKKRWRWPKASVIVRRFVSRA